MTTAGLPLAGRLALRYLRAPGGRARLSLFAWIGTGGVFLGVAALVVVLATMTGFQEGIRDRVIGASPHLLVFGEGAAGLAGGDAVARRIAAIPGVRTASPFVVQQALFTGAQGSAHGGIVRGLDRAGIAGLAPLVRRGRLDGIEGPGLGLALGSELARSLGVVPGDVITLISPRGAETAVGLVPLMRRATICAVVEAGLHDVDATLAYTSLAAAQEFAGLGAAVTGVEARLVDPFAARRLAPAVRDAAGPGHWVRDWMELHRALFAALQLEKLALFVVVTIIVLVAAFAIVGHLVLLVADRRREIGILLALGAPAGTVTAIFFTVGTLIGLAGTAAGALAGWGLVWLQNTFRLIRLAGEVYQLDHLPMRVTVGDAALVIGAALGLSLLATWFPARRAGRLRPADVLRYE